VDGISFVTDGRWHFALSGLTIDVQDHWGREALVAYNSGLGGSC
jgi:hypothetical protein